MPKEKTNFEQLDSICNYETNPGSHSILSPVSGSRFHELYKIYQFRDIFSVYQNAVYEYQDIFIFNKQDKDRAEEISKVKLLEFLSKYENSHLTIENAIAWKPRSFGSRRLESTESNKTTWHTYVLVSPPGTFHHYTDAARYTSAYLTAIHELMHVEECPIGATSAEEFRPIIEVLTATQTIILLDEVYKKIHNIDMDSVVDYKNEFTLFGKTISQGQLANFYRTLSKKYATLADALTSTESMMFLGCDSNTVALCNSRLVEMDVRRKAYETEKANELYFRKFHMKHIGPILEEINGLRIELGKFKDNLDDLNGRKKGVEDLIKRGNDESLPPLRARLQKLDKNISDLELQNKANLERLDVLDDALPLKKAEVNNLWNANLLKMETLLTDLNFNTHLNFIKNKALKYKGIEREDATSLVRAANELYAALVLAKSNFLQLNNSIEIKKAIFKKTCLNAIKNSREILGQHRGWSQWFADFASLIVSVLSLGLANAISGRGVWGLFPTPTDSTNKLNDFENAIHLEIPTLA